MKRDRFITPPTDTPFFPTIAKPQFHYEVKVRTSLDDIWALKQVWLRVVTPFKIPIIAQILICMIRYYTPEITEIRITPKGTRDHHYYSVNFEKDM